MTWKRSGGRGASSAAAAATALRLSRSRPAVQKGEGVGRWIHHGVYAGEQPAVGLGTRVLSSPGGPERLVGKGWGRGGERGGRARRVKGAALPPEQPWKGW